jgi:hypothetical protein
MTARCSSGAVSCDVISTKKCRHAFHRLLAAHALLKGQIRSTPFARIRRSLGDAMADRIEVQDRNLVRPSSQNRAQKASYRNTALQHPTEMHHTILFSRLRLMFREVETHPLTGEQSLVLTPIFGFNRHRSNFRIGNEVVTPQRPACLGLSRLVHSCCFCPAS